MTGPTRRLRPDLMKRFENTLELHARSPVSAVVLCLMLTISSGAFAAAVGYTKPGGNANIQADAVEVDLRNDAQQYSGNVQVSQGPLSIESGSATVRASQTPRSQYTFERSVHMRTADADLKSDSATAASLNGQIARAVVKGSPATFEQRRGTADKTVRGRASVIDYDVANGIVKLSDNVWFSYGGNEFRGNVVVYNIREERVTVNPVGQGDGNSNGRVNITIKPKSLDKKPTGAAPGSTTPPGREDGA